MTDDKNKDEDMREDEITSGQKGGKSSSDKDGSKTQEMEDDDYSSYIE